MTDQSVIHAVPFVQLLLEEKQGQGAKRFPHLEVIVKDMQGDVDGIFSRARQGSHSKAVEAIEKSAAWDPYEILHLICAGTDLDWHIERIDVYIRTTHFYLYGLNCGGFDEAPLRDRLPG
ncbi:hypothetical protein ACEPPN_002210 [Leptodophora sp. 'Broadleaf-Isolate-01']